MADYIATAIAEGDHWVIDVTGVGTTTAVSVNDLEDMAVDLGPVLAIFAEPEDDCGEDEGGPVVGGAFGVAGGQGAELLESGEAAFNDVASGVDVLVEGGWATAG
jgi:hypothetical protein